MPNLVFGGNDQSICIYVLYVFILTPIYVGFGPLANLHTDNDTYYFHYYLFKLFTHSNPIVTLSTNYYYELAHESVKTSRANEYVRQFL